MAIETTWYQPRVPPTGPRVEGGGVSGAEYVDIQTDGATGEAPVTDTVDLSAVFPIAEYGDHIPTASVVGPGAILPTVECDVFLNDLGTAWVLRVWNWPDGLGATVPSVTVRVGMIPATEVV